MKKFGLKSNYIQLPDNIVKGVVVFMNGKIDDVLPYNSSFDFPIADVGNLHIMPGIIDPHVHINEPGRTEWEGFETATKAALCGGITTMIEMPLNSDPVTTSEKKFHIKLNAAENKLSVNCGFWGGVVPDNLNELDQLLNAGTFGLKAFLTHSGIDDFPNTNKTELLHALKILKKHNKPLLVHCELDVSHADEKYLEQNPRSYDAYLKSRPKEWEDNAISMMIDLCRETMAHVHIVHLSSANSIQQIKNAKAEGLPLTVETAPHYLFFSAEKIEDGATAYKCAPPIRQKENNDALWNALLDGAIDFIATDHSPAPPTMKEIESGNFKKAWGGIAGLQFSLPVVWSKMQKRNISISHLAKWFCEEPAKLCGLENSKGKIKKGYDADVIVWNPEEEFTVKEEMIQHRHKITPYLGKKLKGVVEKVFLKSEMIFDNKTFVDLNRGEILLKK